jgi:prepilin-type N-terminal cleavage/methylation domain-containing protein
MKINKTSTTYSLLKQRERISAFTLIELLVVIAIIAILASIALPVFSSVQERGKQTKDMSNGKQIGLALKQFAQDNNGQFPQYMPNTSYAAAQTAGVLAATSNDALWWLLPTYMTDENVFCVAGSHWSKASADNLLDAAGVGTRTNTLAPGECAYVYILGLNDTSNSGFPLIADAGTNPAAAAYGYTNNKNNAGGVWGGKKAVVIKVDGSGQAMTCDDTAQTTIFRPGTTTANNTIFNASTDANVTWLDDTVNLKLNPVTTGVPYP